MMDARVSLVSFDHLVISSMLRKQPVQIRASGWITQICTQGLWISSRFQMSSLISAFQELQPVQHPLKDVARGDMVNNLGTFRARGIGL